MLNLRRNPNRLVLHLELPLPPRASPAQGTAVTRARLRPRSLPWAERAARLERRRRELELNQTVTYAAWTRSWR